MSRASAGYAPLQAAPSTPAHGDDMAAKLELLEQQVLALTPQRHSSGSVGRGSVRGDTGGVGFVPRLEHEAALHEIASLRQAMSAVPLVLDDEAKLARWKAAVGERPRP